MSASDPMTRERRVRFWKSVGWRQDLPQDQRRVIEETWPDHKIEEVEDRGY